MTTKANVSKLVQDAICEYDESGIMYTTNFEDKGMKTNDTGFVIKMDDGSEFQVVIKERTERDRRLDKLVFECRTPDLDIGV